MTDTIWRATDANGKCYETRKKPIWNGSEWRSSPDRCGEWWNCDDQEKPPPGECWEMTVTRKGEQPTGEAWERLINAVADYSRNVGIVGPRGETIKEAWKAYEAAEPAEPKRPTCGTTAQQATIERLTRERDDARTERHAYKSRLREFCQRLVDMVGAEGPEDVQGMLDKVNAEINRLKQSIDSLSANLADKEGFLNSAGDEIEVLTKERDEALRELANERSRSGQVTTAQINVIAELQEQIRKLKVESATQTDAISERDDRIDQLSGEVQRLTAKLERPEMPEVVRRLIVRLWTDTFDLDVLDLAKSVEAHYSPPFRIDKLGVYATENGNPWEVIYIDPKGGVVARHETTKLLENFHVSGACKGGPFSLTKYLRPLEG
mgnify:CR=1 FL=1